VGKPELKEKIAAALARLGIEHAVVVSGSDGLDEVTLGGTTQVLEIRDHELTTFNWRPEDFGLAPATCREMLITGPQESAAIIRRVLAGERGPCRDVVVLNAAAALWTAGGEGSPIACAQRSAEAIDSGRASALLSRWNVLSNGS